MAYGGKGNLSVGVKESSTITAITSKVRGMTPLPGQRGHQYPNSSSSPYNMHSQFAAFTVVSFEEKDSPVKQVGVVIDYIINRGQTLPRILFNGSLLIHSVRQESITPVVSEGEGWLGLTELASYYEHSLFDSAPVRPHPAKRCRYCDDRFAISFADGNQIIYGPVTRVCTPLKGRRSA